MGAESIDEIFDRTLVGNYDDESTWDAVRTLHRIGSREVFERAVEWCHSGDPLKRARGADVLAQLGRTASNPGNNFPDECFSIVATLVQSEKESLPLLASLHALGHLRNPLAVPLVIAHHLHRDPDVRVAVACALGSFADDSRATDTLQALMREVDDDVRDWATFGLGVLGDLDSQEIRDALGHGLNDPSRDVREESLAGLAKRKDPRALQVLIAELGKHEISDRVLDAAAAFLGDEFADQSPSYYVASLKKRLSM